MFDLFDQFKEISYFITNVHEGESKGAYSTNNLALHTGDHEADVLSNRYKLKQKNGIENLHIPDQTHSANIKSIPLKNGGLDNTDALITNVKNECIAVLTADCVPVLIYNEKQKAVAAIHAGWKGIISEIIPSTIEMMLARYGGKPSNFYVGIGPCISKKSYEVGEDVAQKFDEIFPKQLGVVDRKIGAKPHIDLVLAAQLQLLSCGIPQLQIESCGECTFLNENYFSARRLGLKSGRFASGIMIR